MCNSGYFRYTRKDIVEQRNVQANKGMTQKPPQKLKYIKLKQHLATTVCIYALRRKDEQ